MIQHCYSYRSMMLKFLAIVMTGVSSLAMSDALYYGEHEEISFIEGSLASKQPEALFSSPLSMSVLTAERIRQAGVTSIPEALRLLPGILVRELTNGVFEVHIRGFENTPTNTSGNSINNRLVLLMIDHRVVYDHFNGGLYWESLPIDVEDIEKIEVVSGGMSALYGPNAANGVIHIITKRGSGQTEVNGRTVAGSHGTRLHHLSASHVVQDQFVRISAASNQRDRYQNTYYSYADAQYVPESQLNLIDTVNPFPEPSTAQSIESFSLTLTNDRTSLWHYDLGVYHQQSTAHRIYLAGDGTPYTFTEFETSAINSKINYGNLRSRVSYHKGTHTAHGFPDFNYRFETTQGTLEYHYQLPKWKIQPGIHYEHVQYDSPFVNGKQPLTTMGYLLRSEYTPTRDTNITAAIRLDDYNRPGENYLSYQLFASYLLTHDLMIRGGVSRSNRSAFMVTHFTDLLFDFPSLPNVQAEVKSNPDGDLNVTTTYEIGIRKQFSFYHWLEATLFHTRLNHMSSYVNQGAESDGQNTIITYQLENLPTEVNQQGLTLNWQYEQYQWDLNIFATAQQTHVKNQPVSLEAPLLFYNTDNHGTPSIYGGINFNWKPGERWQFNSHAYYLDQHAFILQQPAGQASFASTWLANVTLTYAVSPAVESFVSMRNLSPSQTRQFFYTDEVEPLYMIGIRWQL